MRDLYGVRGVHYDLEYKEPVAIDTPAESPVRKVLDHLLALKCPSCGTVGQYQLEDAIKERRTWKIGAAGVSDEEERDQEDAEPYFVSCQDCGNPLGPLDLDHIALQALIDDKDAASAKAEGRQS